MILLLDTSTPICHLSLIDGGQCFDSEWQADRELARNLLKYLNDQLAIYDASWDSLTGIGVFQGPGSFTGLRIGLTVLNTLADANQIPIVGATGDNWQEIAVARLAAGENDQIILPLYGSDANITKPRK